MATTGEDSLPAHTSNPTDSPTSEVGYKDLLTTMKQQMDFVRDVFRTLTKKDGVELEKFSLPRFNPGSLGSDPAAWCATVDVIMEEKPLRGSALLCALSAALESSAAQWLRHVPATQFSSWPKFKDRFLTRFGGKKTAATALWKMKNEARLEGETLGDYSSRLRSFLMARWDRCTKDEIVNAAVLLHIGSQDQRVLRIALTNDIKTEDQFTGEMTVLSDSVKRPASSISNSSAGPEAKRHKSSDSQHKCYRCGRHGYKAFECRGRTRLEAEKRNRKPGENRAVTSSKVSCYRCNEEGHIAPNCPTLRRGNPATREERQVNFCVVEAPTGKLSHQGESFLFCFDSGAECSLIKESIASKFSGKRTTEIVVMRGIGNTCVKSTILSKFCPPYVSAVLHWR